MSRKPRCWATSLYTGRRCKCRLDSQGTSVDGMPVCWVCWDDAERESRETLTGDVTPEMRREHTEEIVLDGWCSVKLERLESLRAAWARRVAA